MRLQLAVMSGKIAGFLSRALHLGEGSNFPGRVARLIDPQVFPRLAQDRESLLVTGTNGKTTTTHILAGILAKSNHTFVHNAYGANLESGIITSLLSYSNIWGCVKSDFNLFEVDEATLPKILEGSEPLILILTNIFRDQLDRYGDLDHLLKRIHAALRNLPSNTTLVVNADDPLLFFITEGLRQSVIYYGVETHEEIGSDYQVADIISCFHCHSRYEYEVHYYAHLGRYFCPSCGSRRPRPHVYASHIELFHQGSSFLVHHKRGTTSIQLNLPGSYNIYNLLAAFTTSLQLDIHPDGIKESLVDFRPVFGRLEEFYYRGREIKVILVKNPTGFNEVLHLIVTDKREKGFIFLLNDNQADGEDISWIWDVEFSLLKGEGPCYVSGLRSYDMALRLKYSGVESHLFSYNKEAMRKILNEARGDVLYILPTYTALLQLRSRFKELMKEGSLNVS